jgi:RHS repeat-associated protein
MVNSSGTIVARYDYDPYGVTTLVSGTNLATFQYTSDYYHSASALNLTLNRGYDPNTDRWLSRDPLKDAETRQGPNLYEYAKNDPVYFIDPLGLDNQSGGGSVVSGGASFFFIIGGEAGYEKVHLDNCTCQWYKYAGIGIGLQVGYGAQIGRVGNTSNPGDYAGGFWTGQAGAGLVGATVAISPSAPHATAATFGPGTGANAGLSTSYRYYIPVGKPFKCSSAVPGL